MKSSKWISSIKAQSNISECSNNRATFNQARTSTRESLIPCWIRCSRKKSRKKA